MNYEFGEILDARKAPDNHFIVILGEVIKRDKTEILYYKITSRVYAVFKNILDFFNDCISRNDKNFLKHFNKEKSKTTISRHGFLSQAVFLDKYNDYDSCLDLESMVVVNKDPDIIDKDALERLRADGKVVLKNKLTKLDALALINTIKHSDNISADRRNKISANFNKVKSKFK